jgi:NAD+ kinase
LFVRVGIFANGAKPGAVETVGRLRDALKGQGIESVLEAGAAELVGAAGGVAASELGEVADVAAVLGGDGTMLDAVARLGTAELPVAGVNTGRLGFLTSCTETEVDDFAVALAEGRYTRSKRTLLDAEVIEEGGPPRRFTALNEVVLARGHTGRLVSLKAALDGSLLNHYRADGLIVATPTGSTAYSLSAGGPLISPTAGVFVITPICPHSLSHRSLVVEDDSTIELSPAGPLECPMQFTVDGRDCLTIQRAARVVVRKASRHLHLLRLEGHSFYEALREKLNWRGG